MLMILGKPLLYIFANRNFSRPTKLREISELDSTIKTAVVRDFLSDDDSSFLEEELRQSIESQFQQNIPLEKFVISQDCEMITLMTKVKGKIEVNQTLFTFVDLSPPNEDEVKNDFR